MRFQIGNRIRQSAVVHWMGRGLQSWGVRIPLFGDTWPPDWVVKALRMIPPAALRRRVSGTPHQLAYVSTAIEYATILKAVCGLRSDDAVLEPGCGPGRVAAALTFYLRPPGCYHGFDIHLSSIEFARRAFREYSYFHFEHADVRTDYFLDPPGTFARQSVLASEYRFPYSDASFDFVFTVSLFTHMLPEATQRYLRETGRVLKSGGRGMLSGWVLDHRVPGQGLQFMPYADQEQMEREGLITCGYRPAGVPLPYLGLNNAAAPTTAVAYTLAFFEESLRAAGLQLQRGIPGQWSGREREWITLQDILIFKKS